MVVSLLMLLYVAQFDIRWKRCKCKCIDVAIKMGKSIAKSLKWKKTQCQDIIKIKIH